MGTNLTLHELIDWRYGADGAAALRRMLDDAADPDRRNGPLSETPLHVAARRRRPVAVEILLDAGADIDARTGGGKTAFAHPLSRRFNDVVTLDQQAAMRNIDDG